MAIDDPLTLAIAPPPGETPAAREAREAAESEARRISDEIDERLKREREAERRYGKPVRLLLLGQSESGKTATLKNFQLTFASREWKQERSSWRSVIQLNLVRNVNETLNHLSRAMTVVSFHPQDCDLQDSDYSSDDLETIDTKSTTDVPPLKFTEKHRLLRLRLGPLRGVQTDLERGLGAASSEVYSTTVTTAAPFERFAGKRLCNEFSINSSDGWKSALDKFRNMRTARPAIGPGSQRTNDAEDENTEIIASCRDDMKAIWEDSVVQEVLSRHKARIQDSPGFFLDKVERIAVRDYQPTDDDIIRARLRTLGVQEYRFTFEIGRTMGQEWRLYDVGGTRSSRAAWYPYFDDVDAILFLAPISCFNEKLTEDRHVNRLEDSYSLWLSLCSCKLLARTQIILFLNKCDLLAAKLKRGVKIKDHVPSYGDRKNDLEAAAKYFQQHFKAISKKYSPIPRTFYVHLTSVIDTKSTANTLSKVEESILLHHLHHSDLA